MQSVAVRYRSHHQSAGAQPVGFTACHSAVFAVDAQNPDLKSKGPDGIGVLIAVDARLGAIRKLLTER